ncbi:pseudouridine synthase [Algoriphagus namhaensis]
MKNPKKQFFKQSESPSEGESRPKRSDDKRSETSRKAKFTDKKSDGDSALKFDSRKPKTEKRGFGKKRPFGTNQEEKDSEKKYYQGRSKGEKPVYGTEKPKRFAEGKPNRGFGKKRTEWQTTEAERPDYNFDAVPSKKKASAEDEFRLNKFIANSGICSRREADELIKKGQITVNGEVVTEMGLKVKRTDRVVYQGKKINPEKPVYILLNKPKDFITTTDDPMERKTVMNLVKNACEERIFPVGRLDRNTTGLLFFTNDGELAAKLSHPSNQVKKIYQVTLDKPLTQNDEIAVREGLTLEDGPAPVDDIQVLSLDRKILGLEIHIGRNRIVRRIFAHLGYEVTALDRVMYAGLDKKDLKRGNYRFLSEKEVIRLKYFI